MVGLRGFKMKKSIIFISILALNACYADEALDAKRAAWSKHYLEQQGLPAPDGGVKIVSVEKFNAREAEKTNLMKVRKDIKKYGYSPRESESARQLLALDVTAVRDLKAHANDLSPMQTHLRKRINDLRLAYIPTLIPSSIFDKYIGAAPAMTYNKEQGWTGSVQFFHNKSIGNCSLTEKNVPLNHSSAILEKDFVSYDVNNKVTIVEVIGKKTSGFSYTVEWYDNNFFRTLECANENYSQSYTTNAIEIAKTIDNQG